MTPSPMKKRPRMTDQKLCLIVGSGSKLQNNINFVNMLVRWKVGPYPMVYWDRQGPHSHRPVGRERKDWSGRSPHHPWPGGDRAVVGKPWNVIGRLSCINLCCITLIFLEGILDRANYFYSQT